MMVIYPMILLKLIEIVRFWIYFEEKIIESGDMGVK